MEITKFQEFQNSPSTPRTPKLREKVKKSYSLFAEKFKEGGGGQPSSPQKNATSARDNATEIAAIRSAEELKIDFTRALSLKRGDLAIIQGEVFRCNPLAMHLKDVPLVIKRLECVDRRTYDLKVYEADTLARFQGHPNIVSLFSYWAEKPASSYVYKTLVLLMEEGIAGDLLHSVILNTKQRPKPRLCLRYLCDMCKGIIAVHNCNIIHGRVKPSSMYLDGHNNLMLGEFGKTELDSARQTHQLFSKVLIHEATPRTLVYWAPELLKLEAYGKQVDMWALGVTFYQLVTGQHPFAVEDETKFRDEALSGTVNWEPLNRPELERHRVIIQNLIKVNPAERWPANEVLMFAQQEFAVIIQKAWRGHKARMDYKNILKSAHLVKAVLQGHATRVKYLKEREAIHQRAAISIQTMWRCFQAMKKFARARNIILRMQANVLSWQGRRAYLQYRHDTVVCQSFVRRYLARNWFKKIREQRKVLEAKLLTIQAMVVKYQQSFDQFGTLLASSSVAPQSVKASIPHPETTTTTSAPPLPATTAATTSSPPSTTSTAPTGAASTTNTAAAATITSTSAQPPQVTPAAPISLPKALQHLASFEDFELSQPPREYGAVECLPKLRAASTKIAALESDIKKLQTRLQELESAEVRKKEEEVLLKVELGSKFEELDPMIAALKTSLKRVEDACKRAQYLPLKIQHPYSYTKWEIVHEPQNVVENILKDDETVYRALSPSLDLALCNGQLCFVSEVEICPGECGPASIEIYTSNVLDKWTFVKSFKCTRDLVQPFRLPGEQICKYLRIKMDQNVRGGNIIATRLMRVKGLVKE